MDTLRVETWDEFVGQEKLKSRLSIHIRAARSEQRRLDHILLASPPGYGKTALASIIAREMSQHFERYTMPLEERSLRRVLEQAQYENHVLMLDEVHRLPPKQQELFLPVLEFGSFNTKGGRRVDCDITIVAATTEPQKLIAPLYDRFPIRPDFDDYADEELARIVHLMSTKVNVEFTQETVEQLGKAAGGTPRRARQFVLAARDLQAIYHVAPTAQAVLHLCRIDESGLSHQHLLYLKTLDQAGGVAGIKTLQNLLNLNEPAVRDLERLLLKQNLVTYTERGRELTSPGYRKVQASGSKATTHTP